MRLLFPIVALYMATFSVLLDFAKPSSDGALCSLGLCRFDQLFVSIDSKGADHANLAALLNQDPANPLVWCTYGEFLASHHELEKAAAAFDRAVDLGPDMAPVLMRAANYDFSHDRAPHGAQLARRILSQTDDFDEVLFSYFLHSGVPIPKLLDTGVAADPRVARSWLAWTSRNGSAEDLSAISSWMTQRRLMDATLAIETAQNLWQREAFVSAQHWWTDWLGANTGAYPDPQKLWNPRFENEFNGSLFDWALSSPAAEIARKDGLDIRFTGYPEADLDVHQFTTVSPGRYRFSAEISATDLAAQECPVFRVFDPSTSPPAVRRLDVRTHPIGGTIPRSWVNLEFDVPPGMQALEVQLLRPARSGFSNRIFGMLHVYQVSLISCRGNERTCTGSGVTAVPPPKISQISQSLRP